ncbi:MAG: helix-turn-helix transcriptional regulator [Planctomycetes bacterium]|nr:helix-turn-helix transcriptional regulator [Planctomycetota bacterium]
MASTPATVPLRLLRQAVAYRTLGGGQGMRIGTGFLLKSGRSEDIPWRRLPTYSAVWCLRGSGTYIDEHRRRHPVRAGSLFHRFHDRPNGSVLDPASHWAEVFIVLPAGIVDTMMGAGVIDPRRPVVEPGIDLAILADLDALREELLAAGESDLPRLMARLTEILACVLARDGHVGESPRRRLMDTACRRLGDEPRCDLRRLARELGLSYERFRKVFRETTGVSPAAYRIRRRIDRARRLLVVDARPLAAIADELGYANAFAFSVQFKRQVGESPEAYRQRH